MAIRCARGRRFLSVKIEEWERALPDRSSYWLTRFVLLRLLGVIYAIAFLVAANQILPLIGSDGLLPLDNYIQHVATCSAAR